MRTELLDFHLPAELIATRPLPERDGGRVCVVGSEGVEHRRVREFADWIRPNDLVVLNQTMVRRARLICSRPSSAKGGGGARVELLFLHPTENEQWVAIGKANRPLRKGDRLMAGGLSICVESRGEEGTILVSVQGDLEELLSRIGTMPIPPYMSRPGDEEDAERYQTVFASTLGSAAAPTAGLHLTEELIAAFEKKGANIGRLNLHVGLGTFRPVKTEDLNEHAMHSEMIEIDEVLVDQVARTRQLGGRVVAIGTTCVRALESARDPAQATQIVACQKWTNLLIQPGYSFGVVDALWTNFHQPKSTLLALVAAFSGLERMRRAYKEAIDQGYRFLSYGDAMWIPSRLSDDRKER